MDGVGNPLHYNNGTSYNMTWTMGNRLATVSKGSNNTSSYVYDSDGLRTEKTVVDSSGTSRTKYFWEGNVLQSETHENEGYSIIYVYDSDGQAVGFYYKAGTVTAFYRYVRNIFGDVTHIINENCQIEAVYTYDSWGKLLSIKNGSETNITNSKTSIGYRNSLRYRGYYYDTETGLYYLNSRYYDPEVGRWINADNQIPGVGGNVQGYNLFAYCFNNPVNMSDTTGNWPRWITAAVAVLATVVAVVAAPEVASVAATVAVVATVAYVAQSHHYDKRQAKNTDLPRTKQEAEDLNWKNSNKYDAKTNPNGGGPLADCHQYSAVNGDNIKYVSPDGHREVIYNSSGNIVLDSRDVGTYNIVPYKGDALSFIGHGLCDVVPWVLFGNNDEDPGPIANWVIQLFE